MGAGGAWAWRDTGRDADHRGHHGGSLATDQRPGRTQGGRASRRRHAAGLAPQAFSLSAAGNSARALQTIPVSYGRLRKYCDFATLPWSEFVGDEQYLNILLCEGGGKYQHEQVLIDDTILWTSASGFNPDFDCVMAFYDPGQTVTLFPANVTTAVEVSGQQLPPGSGSNPVNDLPPPTPGPWIGGFIANGPGTIADTLALDFAFPAGCFVVNRDGDYFGRPVRVEAEYRAVNDAGAPIGDWSQLFFTVPAYNTRKPQKFSQKVAVPPGRYEVRARRYGAEAADFDAKINGASGSDGLIWLQLRAYLQGNSTFAKESTIAIRIRATQISQGSARKFSVISTRILPVWDGSNIRRSAHAQSAVGVSRCGDQHRLWRQASGGKIDFATIVNMATGADTRGDMFDSNSVRPIRSLMLSTPSSNRPARAIAGPATCFRPCATRRAPSRNSCLRIVRSFAARSRSIGPSTPPIRPTRSSSNISTRTSGARPRSSTRPTARCSPRPTQPASASTA